MRMVGQSDCHVNFTHFFLALNLLVPLFLTSVQAFDQQQQDLVDAASKAISYRQDIIEENIRLTYALQVCLHLHVAHIFLPPSISVLMLMIRSIWRRTCFVLQFLDYCVLVNIPSLFILFGFPRFSPCGYLSLSTWFLFQLYDVSICNQLMLCGFDSLF